MSSFFLFLIGIGLIQVWKIPLNIYTRVSISLRSLASRRMLCYFLFSVPCQLGFHLLPLIRDAAPDQTDSPRLGWKHHHGLLEFTDRREGNVLPWQASFHKMLFISDIKASIASSRHKASGDNNFCSLNCS